MPSSASSYNPGYFLETIPDYTFLLGRRDGEVFGDITIFKNRKEQKKQTIIESDGTNITSPIVGTAYLAPEPGAKKFIEEGQKIKKGQTIIIIEAMKTMNHVPSTLDGVVSKVLVKDGEPVEFGQPLISLK